MNCIDVRNGHEQLRLEYFSFLKPVLKTSNYTISSKSLDEATTTDRKMRLISVGCDCACTGQK